MGFSSLINIWSNTPTDAQVVIVTDDERQQLAAAIQRDIPRSMIVNAVHQVDFMDTLIQLNERDLVIVLLSIHSFIHKKLNATFSPFKKPNGVKAKYIFIRLDITRASLLEGLSTPLSLIENTVQSMLQTPENSILRVTNPSGTDLKLTINKFKVSNYITDTEKAAFLPPSELFAGILPQSANGKIVVDVIVGQLIKQGELIGEFGLVDEPVILIVKESEIIDILGGTMATELKSKLFEVEKCCRVLVELGHGLSKITPTGIIGIDESIIDTCHFGIGDGTSYGIDNKAPIHLDVVISNPTIKLLNL